MEITKYEIMKTMCPWDNQNAPGANDALDTHCMLDIQNACIAIKPLW